MKEVVRVRTQKKAKLSRPAGVSDKMGIKMPSGALKQIKSEKQRAEEAREKRVAELMKICLNILRQVGCPQDATCHWLLVDSYALADLDTLPQFSAFVKYRGVAELIRSASTVCARWAVCTTPPGTSLF